ncbi:MAG: hypothetical protein ABSG86_17940 [Thermoguttaceae bacterium]|jgi:hypothetical protein
MTTAELREQNELADSLISKLERVKALWDVIPGTEELEDLAKAVNNIATSLQEATDTYNSDDFPGGANGLNDLLTTVAAIGSSLQEASDTYNSDDFPSQANGLNDVVTTAAGIATSLQEAQEARADLDE